jgi:hypothetical protein
VTSQPASAAAGNERLKMPTIGELLAQHRRHRSAVHQALASGATWAQIAAMTGVPEHLARQGYRPVGQRPARTLAAVGRRWTRPDRPRRRIAPGSRSQRVLLEVEQ